MVGFVSDSEPAIEDQTSKARGPSNPLDLLDQKVVDLSFADTFLDFDSIQNWFEDVPIGSEAMQGGSFGPEAVEGSSCGAGLGEDLLKSGFRLKVGSCEEMSGVSDSVVNIGKQGGCGLVGGTLGGSINEEMGRISLAFGSGAPVAGDGVCVKTNVGSDLDRSKGNLMIPYATADCLKKNDGSANVLKVEGMIDDGGESESTSESDSVSSSSSSSEEDDSDEEDDDEESEEEEGEEEERMEVKRKVDKVVEVEEGEIQEVGQEESSKGTHDSEEDDDNDGKDEDVDSAEDVVSWSDAGDEDDGAAGSSGAGPIRSKNELKVLPPVPPVNATLEPHHQLTPVGVVSSILGAQIIVEGVQKHNPINEGSILWITENRTPLGLVDEIFGPVKNPYYVVRYNSEAEVPAMVHQGTLISSVPEYATYVLNEKNLYKKGYDASGENDEELSGEAEFSDDEKEAEYRKMQRIAKRGVNINDLKSVNRKNNKKKVKSGEAWQLNQSRHQPQLNRSQHETRHNQNKHHFSPVASEPTHVNSASSLAIQPGFVAGNGINLPTPIILPSGSSPGLPPQQLWMNGIPCQLSTGAVFANGIQNGVLWPSQSAQIPFQFPVPNQMPFAQQFDASQILNPNVFLPVSQSNALQGPGLAAYSRPMTDNCLNPMTVGVGAIGQRSHPAFNTGEHAIQFNGNLVAQSSNLCPPSIIPPRPFTHGPSSGRGRKPYHGRGGRFSGGRGRQRTN